MWLNLLGFVIAIALMVAVAKVVMWWEHRKQSPLLPGGGGRQRPVRPPSIDEPGDPAGPTIVHPGEGP